MKKFTLALLSLIILGSITAFAATQLGFTDEDSFDDWFFPAADRMREAGIIKGFPDGEFKPSNNVTRAELAVILDRYADVTNTELVRQDIACTLELRSGITLHVQDQDGNFVNDAEVSVSSEKGTIESSGSDGVYNGLWEGEGYYTFTVNALGYNPYKETIKLEQDECHVISQTRTITLVRSPEVPLFN